MIIFLDIDDTIAKYNVMQPDMIAQLNRVVSACDIKPTLVFNSAWNSRGEMCILEKMIEAGFKDENIGCITRTPGSSGGGNLIRKWITTSDCIGSPYVIIDDSTHDLGAMWCRIARCNVETGLTAEVADKAIAIMNRKIIDCGERLAAVNSISETIDYILNRTHLSEDDRNGYALEKFNMIRELLDDDFFLRSAMLER